MQQFHHSLSLTIQGHKEVEQQLKQKQWTIAQLADVASVHLTIAQNFQAGKQVDSESFSRLCHAIQIHWGSVCAQTLDSLQAMSPSCLCEFSGCTTDLDACHELSFQIIRQQCREKILSQHSKIRLFNQQLIEIDQLYVDSYFLNAPTKISELTALGRWGVRKSSFAVANAPSPLLVLGKPGAGKTTLLKQLAIACCRGQFKSELIPVWIELQPVDHPHWHFLYAILEAMGLCSQESHAQEFAQDRERLNQLLTQGQLLIFIDGLDEVPLAFRKKVQEQICWLLQHPVYRKNDVILSCRTPTIEAWSPRWKNQLFTAVEIADLNERQVESFVQAWLQTRREAQQPLERPWQSFFSSLRRCFERRELTLTPMLLGLACWVFENTGDLPPQVSQLYGAAIELLLTPGQAELQVSSKLAERIYHQLTSLDRRQILMEIAIRKIETSPNFVIFDQSELVNWINQILELHHYRDGLAILMMIADKQGLLIQKADRRWSFSHSIFQEYFITQWLLQQSPMQLAEKLIHPSWQPAIEQIVRSQKQSDRLIGALKQAIDQMLAQDTQLQTLLRWVNQKANTLVVPYKPAAVRMFYLGLAHALTSDLSRDLARARALDAALAIDVTLDLDLDFNLDLDFALARILARALDFDLDRALALARALARALDCTLALAHTPALALDCALEETLSLDLIRALDYALDCARTLAPDLTHSLAHYRAIILAAEQNGMDTFLGWWQLYGQQWIEQLRQIIITHRNLGHAWPLSRQQKERLKQYDRANQFLVQLLKIEGAVSEATKSQIETTLLLPATRIF
ncbi:NACHT domain-containing protein [Alkalinema sp. FACHB-956]|uniref:NACHT domain-containing protein n=1 Tax=Alkalinema sp. FACHB-956 TaxID=2692768 RepID=UPI0016898DCF|nr:NACHT domain-containing protein [Alkalinema sp. FACHB-956]MBD2328153.1 NACHT domain-containing protein [Alkalinema sp. FACHB-956]